MTNAKQEKMQLTLSAENSDWADCPLIPAMVGPTFETAGKFLISSDFIDEVQEHVHGKAINSTRAMNVASLVDHDFLFNLSLDEEAAIPAIIVYLFDRGRLSIR
jgi:hypothetical protein